MRANLESLDEASASPRYAFDQLVIAISQFGETADTLAALRHAKNLGQAHTLDICNVPESANVRESELRFITRAGPEISVASTKAFTTQLSALFLLTLVVGKLRGRIAEQADDDHLASVRHLPVAVWRMLELEPAWANDIARRHYALFFGRGGYWPIALESALKNKGISYIHAEEYAAGELKHGASVALADRDMPVIAVAPKDSLLDKLPSNFKEVQARGGVLYVLADADSHFPDTKQIHVLSLSEYYRDLSPIFHVLPMQQQPQNMALSKGTDVDKPRSLVKSETVE